MRVWFTLVLIVFISHSPMAGAGNHDNILRFGLHVSAMGHLDPHFAAGSQDRAFADMVFNGLLRYVPGNAPKIEPDLAANMPQFRMEHGEQIWTITLRKGVMFHSGPGMPSYELTIDDVIFSLNKSADKKFCAYSGDYAGLTLKKLDQYTLEILPEKPISSILFFPKLTNYGGGFIVSKKAIETMGYDTFKKHPIGTGPFKFSSHEPDRFISLAAHKTYFRGEPELAGVEIHFMPDLDTREKALRQKQMDVIMGSGRKGWIQSIETLPEVSVDTHGAGEVGTIHLNTRMKPLDDIRIRKAIAYALGRQDFLATISPRISGPVFSPVPDRFLPGGIPEQDAAQLNLTYAKNLIKARQLMSEAGYQDGFSLDLVSSEKRVYRRSYEALKDQLAQIGIRCNIEVVPHSAMHKAIRNAPKAIVIYYAWRPNADAYLTRFFHSDSIVLSGRRPDTNFSHYSKIDRLIEAARQETDPNTQINLWVQAQIRILNDMAALPVMFGRNCYARSSRVDYGHSLVSTMALYPQFTEKTHLNR
ncbi:MAG: ABC transporter substrate-binding protein [Desulfobacterales bacterium]|nr:ABC transporter substrate-binding protein [Desulfobacterales bacterium]